MLFPSTQQKIDRKSTSLGHRTRWGLINSLFQTIKILSTLLDNSDDVQVESAGAYDRKNDAPVNESQKSSTTTHGGAAGVVVSQQFRDAFACHLYMLFSVMFFMESEAKIGSGLKTGGTTSGGKGGRGGDKHAAREAEEVIRMRATCADAMLVAAQSMSRNRNRLWKRGVPDETVVVLPCRIAYQMLESATGILARKAASGDAALAMIAATVDSCDSLMGTISAALMDMLHSYEHMAPLCAELCSMVSEKPTNRLAIEVIREIGRLDTSSVADAGKASGIKNVAPFIPELALCRPRLVLSNIAHLLPHLDSEPYCLRSAIVTALGHLVEHIGKSLQPNDPNAVGPGDIPPSTEENGTTKSSLEKSRGTLLEILTARSHDVSSYTRSAVLKAWINLVQSGSLPVQRVIAVTLLAIDRLQDKTVIVRKQSLQVSSMLGMPVLFEFLC